MVFLVGIDVNLGMYWHMIMLQFVFHMMCECVFGFCPYGCVIGSFIVAHDYVWFDEFMVDGYITMVHVFLT